MKFWLVLFGSFIILWVLGPSAEEREQKRLEAIKIFEAEQAANSPEPAALPEDPKRPVEFPKENIRIQTSRGALPLVAGMARTPFLRRQGLMHYTSWPEGIHGVLFYFDKNAVISMWMKNTHLPLDMVFMDEKGYIRHIAKNTEPFSEDIIRSTVAVRAVFEIPAGSADKWQISLGDQFLHPLFQPSQP